MEIAFNALLDMNLMQEVTATKSADALKITME
jgi:hypothetical protein